MSSNEGARSLLEPTDNEDTVPVEVLDSFEIDTLNVDVELKLPEIISNFEIFKETLENKLEKFNILVSEDGVKDANKTATGLNKISLRIEDIKKTNVDKLMEPINVFKNNCDQLKTLVQNKRQGLLTQIKVFEDKERALVKRFLQEDLVNFYEKFGVNSEFQTVKFDDLIVAGNKAKLGLKGKVKGQLEARVIECKRLQEKIELRLTTLEGTCYKRGLDAPLVRKNIESFLKEVDDSKYDEKLFSLIKSEIGRLAQMKAKIEHNAQVEAEAKAKAKAKLVAQTQPTVHVNQTPTNTVNQTPRQNTQPTAQPKTSIKLTGNVKKYVVTAVFEIEVDEAYEPYLKSHLLKKFDQACITNLPEITISEKKKVSEDNVPSGPQKEGSFF